jgi:hypothetical protein
VDILDLLFGDAGFRNGLLIGALTTGAVTAIAVLRPATRPGRAHPVRLIGLVAVAASVTALDRTGPRVLLSDRLVWGLALLVGLPLVAAFLGGPTNAWARLAAFVVAVPGALVVGQATSLQNQVHWVPELVALTALVAGALVVDYDEANARSGLAPVLLAITVFGMWTTVPDTEQVLVVLGVFVPLALLGWPVVRAAEGAAAYGVVGLLAWVAAVGGRGRPGSVVGAVACLGVLLVEPLVRRLWRGRASLPTRPLSRRSLLTVAIHAVVVLLAARVAGLETSARTAAAASAVALLAGGIAMGLAIGPRWSPGARDQAGRAGRDPPVS